MISCRRVALPALVAILAGCAESTEILSDPSGARISVNGRFVGAAPVIFAVPREEFSAQEFTVTAEREGYEPGGFQLQKRTCPGRIVGGVFTLGIVFLFRPPTCFDSPQTVSLVALPTAPADAQKPTIGERLQHLDQLRDERRITPAEYERIRRQILEDL
jgi:hypothetical protein